MKKFKEVYKETVDRIPVPGFRTEEISEENQNKRTLLYRRKRHMAAAAFAGGIFVIYTLGGVAAGYARSLVQVDESGFQTMDMNASLLTEETQELQRTAEDASSEESGIVTLAETGGTSVETADSGVMGRMADAEGSAAAGTGASDVAVLEDLEIKMEQEYAIPLALPNESLPDDLKQEEYILTGENSLLVRLETEESVLLLHQSYYGDTSGHTSEAVYPGDMCNERIYTTQQGFAYKVVDSSDGEQIHAAISVGDYELILDFYGYTEKEAYGVLEDMDLSVYL